MGNKRLPTDFKVEIDSSSRFYLRDGVLLLDPIDSSGDDAFPTDRMFFEKNGEPDLIDVFNGSTYSWETEEIILTDLGRKLIIEANHKFQPDTIYIRFYVEWTNLDDVFKIILFKDNTLLGIGNYYNEIFTLDATSFTSGFYTLVLDSNDFPPDIHSHNFYIKYMSSAG